MIKIAGEGFVYEADGSSAPLCYRYEIVRDPEWWLDINKDTGAIYARRTFNMRSPHVKNNVYTAIVKVTGQLIWTFPQETRL